MEPMPTPAPSGSEAMEPMPTPAPSESAVTEPMPTPAPSGSEAMEPMPTPAPEPEKTAGSMIPAPGSQEDEAPGPAAATTRQDPSYRQYLARFTSLLSGWYERIKDLWGPG